MAIVSTHGINSLPHGSPAPAEVIINGRSYPIVAIGNQLWMTEDLQWDDSGEGIKTGKIWDGEGFAGKIYYNWDAATRVANKVGDGWRLPSQDDFDTLFSTVGSNTATKLKSTTGWPTGMSSYPYDGNGTDDFGFNGKPTGRYYGNTPEYNFPNDEPQDVKEFFWTSTVKSSDTAYAYWIVFTISAFTSGEYNLKVCSLPVRLVKDI